MLGIGNIYNSRQHFRTEKYQISWQIKYEESENTETEKP